MEVSAKKEFKILFSKHFTMFQTSSNSQNEALRDGTLIDVTESRLPPISGNVKIQAAPLELPVSNAIPARAENSIVPTGSNHKGNLYEILNDVALGDFGKKNSRKFSLA